ncbi:hypothetical protein ACFLWS_01720 [Chloroflexota bacterium]
MTNETLITVNWELCQQGMPKSRIAQRLGKHRETIHLWVTGIKGLGLLGFPDKYQQAKRGERKKRLRQMTNRPRCIILSLCPRPVSQRRHPEFRFSYTTVEGEEDKGVEDDNEYY